MSKKISWVFAVAVLLPGILTGNIPGQKEPYPGAVFGSRGASFLGTQRNRENDRGMGQCAGGVQGTA